VADLSKIAAREILSSIERAAENGDSIHYLEITSESLSRAKVKPYDSFYFLNPEESCYGEAICLETAGNFHSFCFVDFEGFRRFPKSQIRTVYEAISDEELKKLRRYDRFSQPGQILEHLEPEEERERTIDDYETERAGKSPKSLKRMDSKK
jgi:hypothetical protein